MAWAVLVWSGAPERREREKKGLESSAWKRNPLEMGCDRAGMHREGKKKKILLPQGRGDPVELSGTELKIKLKGELITRYIINSWNSLLHTALEKPNHEEFPKVWTNAGKTDLLVGIK